MYGNHFRALSLEPPVRNSSRSVSIINRSFYFLQVDGKILLEIVKRIVRTKFSGYSINYIGTYTIIFIEKIIISFKIKIEEIIYHLLR